VTMPIPGLALGLFLATLLSQRAAELVLSARNARRLVVRGGYEVAGAHFPLIAGLHAIYPVALVAEMFALDARPGPYWPLWLGAWLAAQVLRYAAIRALGDRWNVRVWVVPREPLVNRGPYRFMRHPNYVAVAVELFAGAMLFGAWRTATVVSVLNLAALRIRIRHEDEALRGDGGPARHAMRRLIARQNGKGVVGRSR
jgi:methyltransferase